VIQCQIRPLSKVKALLPCPMGASAGQRGGSASIRLCKPAIKYVLQSALMCCCRRIVFMMLKAANWLLQRAAFCFERSEPATRTG
jgi:hypothetical protein